MLKIGDKAPDFTFTSDEGKADFLSKISKVSVSSSTSIQRPAPRMHHRSLRIP